MKKLKSQSGFSLSELLVSIAILALITTALAAALPAAMRVYHHATMAAEASSLAGAITTAVSDELRMATKIKADGSFQSASYGRDVAIGSTDGRATIGSYHLLGEGSYTSGLSADVSVRYTGAVFEVSIEIYSPTQTLQSHMISIMPLNS